MFSKTEKFQGFYYLSGNNKPTTLITTRVCWLEEIETTGFLYKTREKKAFKYFENKYPYLIKFIKLF